MSETLGLCPGSDDSGTPSQPTQASFERRSTSCRNHSSEGAPAVFSCMCLGAVSTSDPVGLQNLMVPTKPLKILAEEAIRTVRADRGEEESETVTEHKDGHQDAAPRLGAVSFRRRARRHLVYVGKRNLPHLDDAHMDMVLTICTNAQYTFGSCQSQRNWAWRVDGARARSFWSCCAATPSPRNFFRCAHDSWYRRPLR